MNENAGIKFVNIKVAAKMLGVSPLTLRNWDKKRKLIAFRHPINNYRVYKLSDIENFLSKIEDIPKPKKVKIEFISDELSEDKMDKIGNISSPSEELYI